MICLKCVNKTMKMSCLQVIAAFSDHPLVSVSKQFLGRELESCQLKQRPGHQTLQWHYTKPTAETCPWWGVSTDHIVVKVDRTVSPLDTLIWGSCAFPGSDYNVWTQSTSHPSEWSDQREFEVQVKSLTHYYIKVQFLYFSWVFPFHAT